MPASVRHTRRKFWGSVAGPSFMRSGPPSQRHISSAPRRDSNSRSRLRRAVLYPLSYGGIPLDVPRPRLWAEWQCTSAAADRHSSCVPVLVAAYLGIDRVGPLQARCENHGGGTHPIDITATS